MDNVILTEAFKELKLLEEEAFDVNSTEDMEDAKEFIEDDIDVEPVIEIADVYADEENELLDSYVGKVILECEVCHSKIFEDADKVTVDEEENVANMDEECPYCFSNDGYKVIGQVAPFGQVEEEITVAEEEPVDEIEDGIEEEVPEEDVVEDEIVEESFRRKRKGKRINESKRTRKNRKINESYEGPGLYDIYYYKIGVDGEETEDILYNGESQEIMKQGDLQDIIKDIESHDSGKYVWNYNYCKKVGELEESLNEERDSKSLLSVLNNSFKDRKATLIFSEPGSGVQTLISKWADSNGINITRFNSDDVDRGGNIVADFDKGISRRLPVKDEDTSNNVLIVENPEECGADLLNLIDNNKYRCVIAITHNINNISPAIKSKFRIFDFLEESLDECGDIEECDGSCIEEKDELEEDFKDVSITTDDSHMTMTSDDDGKVTVTTEPVHDEFVDDFTADDMTGGDEMIAPIDDETVSEIEGEDQIEEPFAEEPLGDEEDIDIDIDEFDEEGFDGLGESYLKKVYENVNSFKTTGIREEKNKLYVEGLIGFTSGNKKKTSFIFEAKDIDSKGKIRFIGENKEITRGKKSFTVAGRMNGKKFMCESFNYNYRAKDENGKSTRLYGTIKK